jgi:WD40 repeat protein
MSHTRTRWIAALASCMLFQSFVSGGRGWAQGAPSIVWMSADGAGAVAFSPGGQILASAGSGLYINLRRASDGVLIRSIRDKSSIGTVAFSPDGQLLADGRTNGTTGNLALFRVSDGLLVFRLGGHQNSTHSVAFSPVGNLLASGGDDRTAKLWRVSDGALVNTLAVGSRVHRVAFSPDGQWLATGDQGSVKLWQVSTGALVRTFSPAFGGQVMGLAFSPDGSRVAAVSLDGTTRAWQASTGAVSFTLTLPPSTPNGSVAALAFAPNGFSLVTGNDEVNPTPEHGTVRFWRAADGAPLRLFDQQGGVYVNSIAFSPLGTVFAYSRATDGVVVVARNPF